MFLYNVCIGRLNRTGPGQAWECEKRIISRALMDRDLITIPHLRRQFPETSIIHTGNSILSLLLES
jgi:hypothetical protein